MWLKRSTPQNIVIGGAAGALPPMIGWAAVTGGIALEPVLLFLIIFFWTPPHFWALSLLRADEYARAGVPMLPVVAGARRDAPADPALLARACAASAWRRGCSGYAGLAYGAVGARRRRDHDRARLARLSRAQRTCGSQPRRSSCSPSRSFICSCCSPCCWSSAAICWSRAWVWAMSEQSRRRASCSPRSRSAARRARSIAIALALGALVVLFYVVTLVKGPAVLIRPL